MLCSGLFLLITVLNVRICFDIQIADREISRKAEIDEMLDYIHRQLGQLKVIDEIPDSDVPSIALINRALDVKSCTLNFLAIHIRRENSRLGTVGMALHSWTDSREYWGSID